MSKNNVSQTLNKAHLLRGYFLDSSMLEHNVGLQASLALGFIRTVGTHKLRFLAALVALVLLQSCLLLVDSSALALELEKFCNNHNFAMG